MTTRLRQKLVEQDLRTRWVGRGLIYKRRTTSTMDDARKAAQAGAPHGTVVVAEEQTAGRGRLRDRRWVAPPYQNLYFTIVVRPDLERVQRLSIVTPVAVANGVEQIVGLYPRIKWPNDLRFSGKKFVGILIEGEWSAGKPEFALVGVGINVNFDPATHGTEIAQPATSLALVRGRPIAREPVFAAVLSAFERAYDGATNPVLFEGWRNRSETLGRRVSVSFDDGRTLYGVAEDVAADGALLVRDDHDQLHELHAGEVSLRAEPEA